MTKWQRVGVGFVGLLLTAFVAEHIFLVMDYQLHPTPMLEACPTPKK